MEFDRRNIIVRFGVSFASWKNEGIDPLGLGIAKYTRIDKVTGR